MAENETWNDEQEPVLAATKKETDKKCDMCGGTMDFDPLTGGLLCPYCGHTKAIEPLEESGTVLEKDFTSAEFTENCDWGVAKKTVICKSCGGESIYDALETAGECPYCGSNQVMEAKDVNTLAPDGVCVFKIDQKTAADKFSSWIKKRFFCPKEAKENAKPKSFKGLYLPYWTFDSDTTTRYSGEYGIDRTETNSKGEHITRTDWYKTSGEYSEFIDDQPVTATNRYDVSILKGLEPFNTTESLHYKPEYVAGFVSERYSIGLKDAWEKAKNFIKTRLNSHITDKIKTENHADSVSSLKLTTTYDNIKYKYLMLPVWISSFTYKGKLYQFMVNGQTGRVAGKTPVSALKVALTVLAGLAVLALIVWLSN